MGLCKCPKKKVTNLFCFEHRVNVCENCLVEGHGKCIVQSYLQWLQDSDYNPNCSLCNHSLQDEDCIRLTCYDVFHWRCLNQSMQRLPSNTAPAGYECPICSRPVIPPDNAAGPVVDGIRARLRTASWAQTALVGSATSSATNSSGTVMVAMATQQQAAQPLPPGAVSQRLPTDSVEMTSERSVGHVHGVSKKSGFGAGGVRMAPSPRDVDENKYARRPAFTWLAWVLRSGSGSAGGGPSARRAPLSPKRRLLLVGFLVFLAVSTLLYLMSTLGRQAAESDPMLRPELNPNIRVQHHAAVVGGGGSGPEAI